MNAFAASLAVITGRGASGSPAFQLDHPVLYGTAFSIAPDLFVTAAHVIRAAQDEGKVALARLTPGDFQILEVLQAEMFENVDLALLHCPHLNAERLPLQMEPLDFLTEVFSLGYPFGLELDTKTIQLRAFKGHVVSRRTLTHLSAEPAGYELSFTPPAGLSGSPLLALSHGLPRIAGVVLGSRSIEYRESRLEVGIALDVATLQELQSRILRTILPSGFSNFRT